jgi:N utilization substance protein B
MSGNRRQSRELALKGLYQQRLTGYPAEAIEKQLRDDEDYAKADVAHFSALLGGVIGQATSLDEALQPHLDRPIGELSPIERAILELAAYELMHHLEIPYRVVINEAVELAKSYGGTDGYKYVNGVLDKLAGVVREVEVKARAKQPPRGKGKGQ